MAQIITQNHFSRNPHSEFRIRFPSSFGFCHCLPPPSDLLHFSFFFGHSAFRIPNPKSAFATFALQFANLSV